MQGVTAYSNPSVVHSRSCHAPVITAQYGHHPLGIWIRWMTLGARDSRHCLSPHFRLRHDQGALVLSRASHSRMQGVMAYSDPSVVHPRSRHAPVITA